MSSMAAILAFADMGLSLAVMQCAAHEHAKSSKLPGEDQKLGQLRLEALFAYSLRRVGKIILFVLPPVIATGIFILSSSNNNIHWLGPWLTLCIGSALSLMLSVTLSLHEGCDGVAKVQRIRLNISAVNLATLSLCLIAGLSLWALPISTLTGTAAGAYLISQDRFIVFSRALKMPAAALRDWATEVSPLLSKYALSWISGYLTFQLFVPIVLKLDSAAAAGRAGLTFSVFSAVFSLSNIWSTYQLPKFSMAIAVQDRHALQRCLRQSLRGAVLTYMLLAGAVVIGVILFKDHFRAIDRLQSLEGILLIAAIWLLQLLVHNLAIYLRAFKEEPLVKASTLGALHSVLATVVCVYFFGGNMGSLGMLSMYIWFLPQVVLLYARKRQTTIGWNQR